MNIQDLVADELFKQKTVSAFIYLIECGREVEVKYQGQDIFASADNSRENYSLWIGESEQAFKDVESLLTDSDIRGKNLLAIWNNISIESLF